MQLYAHIIIAVALNVFGDYEVAVVQAEIGIAYISLHYQWRFVLFPPVARTMSMNVWL